MRCAAARGKATHGEVAERAGSSLCMGNQGTPARVRRKKNWSFFKRDVARWEEDAPG